MTLAGSSSTTPPAASFKSCINFKEATRSRLLHEMIQSCNTGDSKSTPKVLIMDDDTLKIMSYTCTVNDASSHGALLLEQIEKRRQPMPCMDAIYFIQPSRKNVRLFLSDMSGGAPLYRKAFVFFSSTIAKELVSCIREKGYVLQNRISALREINLEYFVVDRQGFITNYPNKERALEQLYRDEDSHEGVACLNQMAARVATVFASLKEFPLVRYRAAKSIDATVVTTFRDLIPTILAAGIWDCLMKYTQTIPNFPQTETCELLVLDRSVDQIAPIIHEWTYDAMCHDLLDMEGNKYVYEVPSISGPPEKKDFLLEEHDPVWLELCHEHIGFVSEWLEEKISSFASNNKAARYHTLRYGQSGEVSSRHVKEITEALPEYIEQKEKLSLHTQIVGKLGQISKDLRLQELAELEQNLVFGHAGIKDVIKHLASKELDTSGENKLRLLMILAAIYPDKFEGEADLQMMRKIAKLQSHDMAAVSNMKLFQESRERSSASFPLKFGVAKKGRADRKERPKEKGWRFSRFYPIIEELVEKLSKGELSKEEYPCLNDLSTTWNQAPKVDSMRTKRTPTWAQRRDSDNVRFASSDVQKMGRRIFVFIAGGATRSELRVCHQMTAKLKREVILGSSSLEDPATFITKLKMIRRPADNAMHDLIYEDKE